jgi:hypothetical protein
MKSNLSYAQEFTSNAIEDASTDLNSNDLDVLSEFTARDIEIVHRQRVLDIGNQKAVLLQLGAHVEPQPKPQELLASLLASLDDLSKEQASTLNQLNLTFQQQYADGAERYKAIMLNQTQLNRTFELEAARNEQLQLAYKHLVQANNKLFERAQSLLSFSRILGSRPMSVEAQERRKAEIPMQIEDLGQPKVFRTRSIVNDGSAKDSASTALLSLPPSRLKLSTALMERVNTTAPSSRTQRAAAKKGDRRPSKQAKHKGKKRPHSKQGERANARKE